MRTCHHPTKTEVKVQASTGQGGRQDGEGRLSGSGSNLILHTGAWAPHSHPLCSESPHFLASPSDIALLIKGAMQNYCSPNLQGPSNSQQALLHISEPQGDMARKRFPGPRQDLMDQKFCKIEPENPGIVSLRCIRAHWIKLLGSKLGSWSPILSPQDPQVLLDCHGCTYKCVCVCTQTCCTYNNDKWFIF